MRKSEAAAILMYHAIVSGVPQSKYALSQDAFFSHMKSLAENGFIGLSMWDAVGRGAKCGEKRPVIITFDDGYESDVSMALPILKKFGFSATFFITKNRIGSGAPGTSLEDLRVLSLNGMEIGAHGASHAFLDAIDASELSKELLEPKKYLEELLGITVQSLSFPGGRHSRKVVKQARSAGYKFLCTSVPKTVNLLDLHRDVTHGRFTVKQNTGTNQVLRWATCGRAEIGIGLAKYRAKTFLIRIMGNRIYHRIWKIWNLREIEK